ncbi:unnamed protein product [Cylicocyclus nassatus]|uniref:Uncharacterized protein n=1 Tax=Cylicocyclus nassatus TaxID=53992 RepID=A0AA36GV66_CYLNA|nr:unnamed protein product [Cylicocyclus nassatus]
MYSSYIMASTVGRFLRELRALNIRTFHGLPVSSTTRKANDYATMPAAPDGFGIRSEEDLTGESRAKIDARLSAGDFIISHHYMLVGPVVLP